MRGGRCGDGMKISEKERVKEQEPVKVEVMEPRQLLVRIIAFSIPLVLILGSFLGIPHRLTIPYAVLAALVAGSIALWIHANEDAEGSEWWQDDDASGWRGY